MLTTQTPWGVSQDRRERATGIVFHSTAGHGGYLLSAPRMIEFRGLFANFETFAGGPWFEEDQDWAVVAIAFPDAFTDEMIRGAVKTVGISVEMDGKYGRVRGWRAVADYLASPAGRAVADRAARFEASIANLWEARGCGSALDHDGWDVNVHRGSDGASKTVPFPSYSRKTFYTDAELSELAAQITYKRKPAVMVPCGPCAEEHSDADPGL